MSRQYDQYLLKHITAVMKAAIWLYDHGVIDEPLDLMSHDASKWSAAEYGPYDRHFYPEYADGESQGPDEFDVAWKHHYRINAHHPEHWVDKDGHPADMPKRYIEEMVCDLMAFGFIKGDLHDILEYYAAHKDEIPLSDAARKRFEGYLQKIKLALDEEAA